MSMLDNLANGRPRKSNERHKAERDKARSVASSNIHRDANARAFPFSFLFVVNELLVDSELGSSQGDSSMDCWFNTVPPRHPSGYVREIPSRVMRYMDGEVTEALGYQWHRGGGLPEYPRQEGYVWALDSNGMMFFPATYKSASVFSCNPLLPIVVVDGDPSTQRDARQHPLQFFHPRENDLKGISQAVTEDSPMGDGAGLVKYTAGVNASWIPSLVPPTYSNPNLNAPPSRGLAGELPIIIGLMAFSEAGDSTHCSNRTDEIFLGGNGHRGRWRDRRWHHHKPPNGYSLSACHEPRGFLVIVFFDPENPGGSTEEMLHHFEWHDKIVQEFSSSSSRRA